MRDDQARLEATELWAVQAAGLVMGQHRVEEVTAPVVAVVVAVDMAEVAKEMVEAVEMGDLMEDWVVGLVAEGAWATW